MSLSIGGGKGTSTPFRVQRVIDEAARDTIANGAWEGEGKTRTLDCNALENGDAVARGVQAELARLVSGPAMASYNGGVLSVKWTVLRSAQENIKREKSASKEPFDLSKTKK